MSIKENVEGEFDQVNIVPVSLIKEEEGIYKEKLAVGPKTGSPKKRKDNEISISKYHDQVCKYCEEEKFSGVFVVKYIERKIRKDKRDVDFICKNCLEEKNIVKIKESPSDVSAVGGFTKKDLDDVDFS